MRATALPESVKFVPAKLPLWPFCIFCVGHETYGGSQQWISDFNAKGPKQLGCFAADSQFSGLVGAQKDFSLLIGRSALPSATLWTHKCECGVGACAHSCVFFSFFLSLFLSEFNPSVIMSWARSLWCSHLFGRCFQHEKQSLRWLFLPPPPPIFMSPSLSVNLCFFPITFLLLSAFCSFGFWQSRS